MNAHTILLVEDNLTDEKLALRALSKCNVPNQVVVARDGAEAIDYLLGRGSHAEPNMSALPSLVLLDLKLPRTNGLDVIRTVRSDSRSRLVPIVVLTASREAEDITQSFLYGANAYVRKPVDFTQFLDTANTICDFWLELNQIPGVKQGRL